MVCFTGAHSWRMNGQEVDGAEMGGWTTERQMDRSDPSSLSDQKNPTPPPQRPGPPEQNILGVNVSNSRSPFLGRTQNSPSLPSFLCGMMTRWRPLGWGPRPSWSFGDPMSQQRQVDSAGHDLLGRCGETNSAESLKCAPRSPH